jgi:hypothetical protein
MYAWRDCLGLPVNGISFRLESICAGYWLSSQAHRIERPPPNSLHAVPRYKDPGHAKRSQNGASKAPPPPSPPRPAERRAGSGLALRVACMKCVRPRGMFGRTMPRPRDIRQCNRTLDPFGAMGTIGVHLACLGLNLN